jgi:hypothetical protein
MPRRSISRPTTLFGWHTRSVEPDVRDGPDGPTRSGRPALLRERWALTSPILEPPWAVGLLRRAAAEAVAAVEAAVAEETSA